MNTSSRDAAPLPLALTAPPMARRPMLPVPWHGILRALLVGMLRPRTPAAPPSWQGVAERRRATLAALIALVSASATLLLLGSDALPAQPLLRGLHIALFALLLAWVTGGFVTALMGMVVLWRGDRHGLAPPGHAPISAQARTAIIMPICNEDLATVSAGLLATCRSLAATGALPLFDVFILSDSTDPRIRREEIAAWQRLRALLGDAEAGGARVFYRWRRRRVRRKAGNVEDFCRRWGSRYRYMVVLDADSTMSGDALVQLVRTMEANPRAGIVQTLPRACGQHTLHARAQQFASRVTGRLFALGLAYWQLGDSHYWGHNAILRIEPFMRHCALAPLQGRGGLSGDILSHDFVEAALMRRAGYEVWLAPHIEGSWEQTPANLVDELQRDRRWCQGNLQNARLLAEPGWRPAHRMMFATGAMSYAAAPLWMLFVATALVARGVDDSSWWPLASAAGSALSEGGINGALWALMLVLLLLPRAVGVVAVMLRRESREFGGPPRLVAGALLEALLSALQAPVRMLAHTGFVLSALTGLRIEWKSPPRDADRLPWRHALARFAPGLLIAGGLISLAAASPELSVRWLAPMLLPLLLAAPLAVATGQAHAGHALRRLGLLLIPEERRLAADPQRRASRLAAPAVEAGAAGSPAASTAAAASRLPAHASTAATRSAKPAATASRSFLAPRPAFAFAGMAMMMAALLPRTLDVPPEPPPVTQAMVDAQRMAEAREARAARLAEIALERAAVRELSRRASTRTSELRRRRSAMRS